jgi:zinc transporter
MDHKDGLVNAYVLDGKGGGRTLDWNGVRGWKRGDGVLWVHLQWDEPTAAEWVRRDSGLDPLVADALLAEDTRPRCVAYEDGIMVILRGVNMTPGAEPSDMVSVRIWLDKTRIISMRRASSLAVQDVADGLAIGKGPHDAGEFLVQLAQRLTDRVLPVEDQIGEALDDLEDALVADELESVGEKLAPIRRDTIALRRHLSPQRDALLRLYGDSERWLTAHQRARVRETADRVFRIVEEVDTMRERAAIIQDERRTRISERTEQNIYTLSVIATIILPLTFVTGLFGMNVGGIPGEDGAWAFYVVSGALILIGLLMAVYFHVRRWL